MSSIFSDMPTVGYAGADSRAPLAYQWHHRERVVLGKTVRGHCAWRWPTGTASS